MGLCQSPGGRQREAGYDFDEEHSTRTVWERPDRNERIHWQRDSPMPRLDSFERRILWSTLSKAFEKSNRTASICSCLLRQ